MPGAITKRTRSANKVVPATSKKGAAIISNYARVTKPLQSLPKDLATKTTPSKPAKVETIEIRISCSKKRKADVDVQDENASPAKDVASPQRRAAPRSTKRRQLGTIQNNVQRPQTPRSPEDADLFGTLERLKLQSSPCARRTTTATTTPKAAAAPHPSGLPQELVELINLHAAFTKALAIHHVHNGSGAPVHLRELYPSITQGWRKRQVVLDDVRRCIGVLNFRSSKSSPGQSAAPFHLIDYGRGKVCIELHENAPAILNEALLNQTFEANLKHIWSMNTAPSTTDIRWFIASLPQAHLAASESKAKAAAVLAKGQRTLDEFRLGMQAKKDAEAERKAAQASAANLANADGSKMSLIDRIRYKEALQSQQGPAPTTEQLQRRAALQRVGDIAAVIAMLSTSTAMGRKRVAFTMPAVLTKLKDSLQVPISREEATACIKLLATEVAPQWLKVVTIGARDNVVVLPDFAPSKAAVQERVRVLST